jgi:hypothetical protein
MPTVKEKERVKAISIEYMPIESELDLSRPLVVGQGLADHFVRTEDLGYRTFFGTKRYMCGLDPELVKYDPSLSPEEKEAKIAEIKEIIERLEQFFGKDTLDPTNEKHWSKINLVIDRKTTNLDLTNPRNELIYHCIKAGGFSLVAPSMEAARDGKAPFYIVEPTEYAESMIANKQIINKAIAELEKLNENKSFDSMFLMAKYLLPVEKTYTKRTPKALLYGDLDKWLNGEIVKGSKISFARSFLEATKKKKEDIVVTCFVRDALHFGFLYTNQAGELKNNETGGVYGTTVERCVAHLQNPAYEHELDNIKTRVEQKWME